MASKRENRSLTRDTHARVYQGELNSADYEGLRDLSKARKIPIREILVDSVTAYLGDWDKGRALDVEELILGDGSVRLYLWVPYELCDELERRALKKGIYLQKLIKNALKDRIMSPPGPGDRPKPPLDGLLPKVRQ